MSSLRILERLRVYSCLWLFTGGYRVCETSRFLFFLRDEAPSVIVVHWLTPKALNTDDQHGYALLVSVLCYKGDRFYV